MKRIPFFIIAHLLVLSTFSFGKGQEISMIGGRFSFVFPKGAKWNVGITNVQTSDKTTWVNFDRGGKHYSFVATELNEFYNKDFLVTITQFFYEGITPITKVLLDRDSVIMMIFQDARAANRKGKSTLFIKNSDSTLCRVYIFIDGKDLSDNAGFDKTVGQVIRSFKKGNKRLELAERIESHTVFGSNTIMTVNLPVNYALTWIKDSANGFETYLTQKVVACGNPGKASIFMFIGPVSRHTIHGFTDSMQTESTDGIFMLKKMKWVNFYNQASQDFYRAQIFADDDIKKGVKINIEMRAKTQEDLQQLTEIAESMLFRNLQ